MQPGERMAILEPGCLFIFDKGLELSASEKSEIIHNRQLSDEYEKRGLIKRVQAL